MKFMIQRVTEASVSVDGKVVGEIGKGFFVLIGVCDADTEEIADKMIKKLLGLRIFADKNGKTNLSLADAGGSLLLVSQFTLYADCKKGNRPSFIKAGSPEHAEMLYDYIVRRCNLWAEENKSDMKIQTGIFGADMSCRLTNDGPFTVDLDSEEL